MDVVSFFVTHAQTSTIEQPVECGFYDAAELARRFHLSSQSQLTGFWNFAAQRHDQSLEAVGRQ